MCLYLCFVESSFDLRVYCTIHSEILLLDNSFVSFCQSATDETNKYIELLGVIVIMALTSSYIQDLLSTRIISNVSKMFAVLNSPYTTILQYCALFYKWLRFLRLLQLFTLTQPFKIKCKCVCITFYVMLIWTTNVC